MDELLGRAIEAFDAVCDLPDAERERRLGDLGARDPELRARVEELLAGDRRAGKRFETPAVQHALAGDPAVATPERIGDYRVVRRIRSGGMGAVFEVEQEHPRRHVALKLVHAFSGRELLLRFEREVDVLGSLTHPGIARIYDAGVSEDGQPFFTMELVEGGRTLADELAGRRREPELPGDYYREVAGFFARVADALEAAHRAGVQHRDVKPSNILITPEGAPKVADFGLAHVEDALALSRTGALTGTPFYMSPEQAASKHGAIDHRTDVFSLGATLFEALTLSRPFDGDTSHQVLAKVLTEEPVNPRKLRSRIPRDLAVVCLRALEKSRERRYQTMADLAADLRRFLAHEPILARPAGPLRKAHRWTLRHPVRSTALGLGAASLAAILFLLGENIQARKRLGIANREALQSARDAEDEAENARAEALTSEQVIDFLIGMFEHEVPDRSRGEAITVKEVLDQQARTIRDELPDQPAVRARLMSTMGSVYGALALFEEALPLQEDGLAELREKLGPDHPWTQTSLKQIGGLYYELGRYEAAAEIYEETLETQRENLGPDHPDTLDSMAGLAAIYTRLIRLEEARDLFERAIEGLERTVGEDDWRTLTAMSGLARLYEKLGLYREAIELAERSLAVRRRVYGEDHPRTVTALSNLAVLQYYAGNSQEAIGVFRKLLEAARRIHGEGHVLTFSAMDNLSVTLTEVGLDDEAEELQLRALEGRREVLGEDHPDTLLSCNNLASTYLDTGRLDEAEELLAEAAAIGRRTYGMGDLLTLIIHEKLAIVHRRRGRDQETEEVMLEVLDGWRGAVGSDHHDVLRCLCMLAGFYDETGRAEDATAMWEDALATLRRLPDKGHESTRQAMDLLAGFLDGRGRAEEAAELRAELRELETAGAAQD